MTRYKVICKVSKYNKSLFYTFKTNNLLSLVRYLQNNFDDWYYINVYAYKAYPDIKGKQIASYTKKNPPLSPIVEIKRR